MATGKKTATKRATKKVHDAPEVAHQDNTPKQEVERPARATKTAAAGTKRATKRAGKKTVDAPEVAHQDNAPKQVDAPEFHPTAPTIYVRKSKGGAVLYMQTVTDTTDGARIAAVGELKRMGYDEDAHFLDMSEFDAAKQHAADRLARQG